MNKNNTTFIDATGLNCPVPLTLLKNAIKDLPAGAEVTIEVTDVHAELDFETWCERFNHHLEKTHHDSDVYQFKIIKSA